jgi:hypothetical protein
MEQVLRLILEEREAARAERQANIATLQHLTQIATNHNNHGGNDDDEPRSKLRDLQNSNPPTFTKSTEPLDADDWLHTIENKLEYAGVGENEKVLYATHFLLELCPRGNNKDVIIIILVHDNVYIPC